MSKYNLRIWVIFLVLFVLFFVIVLRLFHLQVSDHNFYKKKSKYQQEKVIKLYPERGDILDRNGELLAVSLPAIAIYVNPKQLDPNQRKEVKSFLNLELGMSDTFIEGLYKRNNTFVWIKRKASIDYKNKLNFKGIHYLPDTIRIYPGQSVAGQIVGFIGLDDEGLSGIEYFFNNHLAGSQGYLIFESDLLGRNIHSYRQKLTPVNNGKPIQLTIDRFLQYMMEQELAKIVTKLEAKRAVAILLDIKSGDILAMASCPFFDPNKFSKYSDSSIFKNNAVSMAFEPGSVMKLFTFASALEEKVINIGEQIYSPEKLWVDGSLIEEAEHPHKEGESATKDIEEVIIKSLNVASAKIGMELGAEKLYRYLRSLGFGSKTNIELPGESTGILPDYRKWYRVDLSRISFGYGIAVTPIQILKGITVFGNDGFIIEPRIVKTTEKPKKGKRIYSAKVVKSMLNIMQRTVEEGTGQQTKLLHYTVGGKTGTSKVFSNKYNRYLRGAYNSTFAGIFPISDPKFAMIVTVVEPKRRKYASSSAVPAFREITKRVIRYYNLEPDKVRD